MKIDFVLLNTTHAGNIGATARAMKTMGLQNLVLVNPQDYPSATATARASGADDVLHAAPVYKEFSSAIQDCQMVFGLSARLRKVNWPQLDARQAAQWVMEQGQGKNIAFVFGQERTGLSNEEMDRCHYLVNIPSEPSFSSLNIASAAQIMAYELRMAQRNNTMTEADNTDLASASELEGLYEHLAITLKEIRFIEKDQPKLMRRLRRLFNRSMLNSTEINLLRGILRAAQASRPQNLIK